MEETLPEQQEGQPELLERQVETFLEQQEGQPELSERQEQQEGQPVEILPELLDRQLETLAEQQVGQPDLVKGLPEQQEAHHMMWERQSKPLEMSEQRVPARPQQLPKLLEGPLVQLERQSEISDKY